MAPYIKAAVRDMKAFRAQRGYRAIPLAYVAADLISLRRPTAEYLACSSSGEDDDDELASSSIELFGMNVYSWCGQSNYYDAKFDELYDDFAEYNVPLAFSETGCNTQTRDFSEVAAMLGSVFQSLFSGSVVYEWAQKESDYGIGE